MNKNHVSYVVKRTSMKKGYSLAELLVVTAIMIMMAGVLIVNQNNNKSQTNVDTAAEQLIAQIRSLQNEALNGKQVDDGTGTMKTVCEFRFDIDTTIDPSRLAFEKSYYDCQASPEVIIKNGPENFNAKKNVKARGDVNLVFTAPVGRISADSVIILEDNADSSVNNSVCICKSGNIFEQKDADDVSDCSC